MAERPGAPAGTAPALVTPEQLGHPARAVRSWPLVVLAAPAFVAIWSGWVGLGALTGFGVIHPLPGIWDTATLNTAITLPVGVETYAAYALRVWLTGTASARAARFARRSAIGSLVLGAGGQVAFHLLAAAGVTRAPWQITAVVACLPVAVLGMGAALAHLTRHPSDPLELGADLERPARLEEPGPVVDLERVVRLEPDPRLEEPAPAAREAQAWRVEPIGRRGHPGPALGVGTGSGAGRVRSAGGSSTAATIARLRAAHPDWTAGQVAAAAGVTDRTVRRHSSTARVSPPVAPSVPVRAGGSEAGDVDRVRVLEVAP